MTRALEKYYTGVNYRAFQTCSPLGTLLPSGSSPLLPYIKISNARVEVRFTHNDTIPRGFVLQLYSNLDQYDVSVEIQATHGP